VEKLFEILTPENVGLILMVILLLLTKNKVVSEQVRARIERMLADGYELGEITDRTVATVEKVKEIAHEVATENTEGDSAKKKIQRGLRKIMRGWIGL